MQSHSNEPVDGLTKLRELLQGFRVAMFTSLTSQHIPHARPMYLTTDSDADELIFMSDTTSMKVFDISANPKVLLTFSNDGSNRYVAVNGVAIAEHNPARAKTLWNIHAQAWWPEGPSDPNLVLIRVRPEDVEYWDGPSKISYSLSLVTALVGGKRMEPDGSHGTVHMPSA